MGISQCPPIHHIFFELFHQWQNGLDNTELHGAFLMDRFYAYDWLPHNLVIVKFETYELDKYSLTLLLHYLTAY